MSEYESTLDVILVAIKNEILRSNEYHSETFYTTHDAYGSIKEELEELWVEIKKDDLLKMHKENIQLACTVVKSLMSYSNYDERLRKRNEKRSAI